MKLYQRRRITAFQRSLDFIDENPLTPPLALATALIAELTAISTSLDNLAGRQDHGFGTVRGAVGIRRTLRDALYETLKDLSQAAGTIDAYPELAGEMMLGRSNNSYEALLARARAFHTALTPTKDAFVALGYPATVDVDLQAQITALDGATERKNSGRAGHIGGTAGLEILCASGLQVLQKLDAILSKAYKDDPAKYAGWKAARRIERSHPGAPNEPSPTDPPVDSGTVLSGT